MEVLPKAFRPGVVVELTGAEAQTLCVALTTATENIADVRAAHKLAAQLKSQLIEALDHANLFGSPE